MNAFVSPSYVNAFLKLKGGQWLASMVPDGTAKASIYWTEFWQGRNSSRVGQHPEKSRFEGTCKADAQQRLGQVWTENQHGQNNARHRPGRILGPHDQRWHRREQYQFYKWGDGGSPMQNTEDFVEPSGRDFFFCKRGLPSPNISANHMARILSTSYVMYMCIHVL